MSPRRCGCTANCCRYSPESSGRRARSWSRRGSRRAAGALWRALAALIGGLARAVGRRAATAHDLDPEHRRDGAALGVIALGLVSSVAIWRHGAGPVGRSLTALFRLLVGNGAGVLP